MVAASDISLLRDRAATLIAAIVPRLETGITFREMHYREPLVMQPPLLSPDETCRTFHVLPRPVPELSDWRRGQTQLEMIQGLDVIIRYQVPPRDDGMKRLANLIATDVPLIHRTFSATPSDTNWGADAVIRDIDMPSINTRATVANAELHVWTIVLDYRLHYALA